MVFRTKESAPVNVKYLETLQKCTKTVYDLYTKYVSSFPEEYISLVAQTSSPNGIIMRISNKQPSNEITVKFMWHKKLGKCVELTDEELFDLVNTWVYLEDGQTPLEFLDLYFKYIINELGITKYRLKQMYQDLELDEPENYKADPDYNPDLDSEDYHEDLEYSEGDKPDSEPDNSASYRHDTSDDSSGSGDTLNLDTTEFEFKKPRYEESDSDNSPDYVPSVESEDEYENNHRNVVTVAKKRTTRTPRMVRKTVY